MQGLAEPRRRRFLELDLGEAGYRFLGTLTLILAGIVLVSAGVVLVKRWVRTWLPLPTMDRVLAMSGEEFERALRQICEREGWWVELTPRSGDFGADLLMSKNGRKVVVQAKRWRKSAGIKAVQEAAGARDVYGADEAWVVCTSGFTKAAVKQAKASRVRLRDGAWLANELSRLGKANQTAA